MSDMTKVFITSMIAVLIFYVCTRQSAEAKIYKWVDGNGVFHFTQELPPRNLNNVQVQNEYSTGKHDKNSGSAASSDNNNEIEYHTKISKKGQKPIHKAALRGDIEQVKKLISQGASIEEMMPNGGTPLMCAVISGNIKLVTWLLDQGAKINATQHDVKATAFTFAVQENNMAAAKLLLDRGAEVIPSTMHGQATLNNTEMISFLASHGASVDVKDDEGNTPLHFACVKGTLAAATLLLDLGANKNATNSHGMTPLHFACFNGRLDIVKLLLARYVKLNEVMSEGHTPLALAKMEGYEEIAKLLASHGARSIVTVN